MSLLKWVRTLAVPLAAGPAGSGQYGHLSSTERLIMAEQLLFFSILLLSCGAAHKLP